MNSPSSRPVLYLPASSELFEFSRFSSRFFSSPESPASSPSSSSSFPSPSLTREFLRPNESVNFFVKIDLPPNAPSRDLLSANFSRFVLDFHFRLDEPLRRPAIFALKFPEKQENCCFIQISADLPDFSSINSCCSVSVDFPCFFSSSSPGSLASSGRFSSGALREFAAQNRGLKEPVKRIQTQQYSFVIVRPFHLSWRVAEQILPSQGSGVEVESGLSGDSLVDLQIEIQITKTNDFSNLPLTPETLSSLSSSSLSIDSLEIFPFSSHFFPLGEFFPSPRGKENFFHQQGKWENQENLIFPIKLEEDEQYSMVYRISFHPGILGTLGPGLKGSMPAIVKYSITTKQEETLSLTQDYNIEWPIIPRPSASFDVFLYFPEAEDFSSPFSFPVHLEIFNKTNKLQNMEILLVRTNHPAMKQLADFVAEEKESLDEKLTPFAAASADFSLWPGTAELSKAPVFSRDSATSPAESVENFLDVDGLRLSSDSSVSALPDESDDFQPKSPALSLISEEGGEAPKEFRRDSYVEGLGSLFSRPAPPPPFRFSSFSLPPNFHFPFLEDSAKEEKIEQTKEEQQTTTEKNSFKGSFEAATSSDSVLFPTVSTDCSSSSPVQRFSLPSLFPFSRRHFSLVGPRIFPGSVTAAAFFQSFCVLLRSPESGQLYKIK